jgi:AraC-like DNA-binding protein
MPTLEFFIDGVQAVFYHLTILLTGFSIFSSLALLIAYQFFLPALAKSLSSRIGCFLMLGGLVGLQLGHYLYFSENVDVLPHRWYISLLLLVPPAFYVSSRAVLLPSATWKLWHLLHFLPFSLGALTLPTLIGPAVAFLSGTCYTFWFARVVYGMRGHSRRFKFEMFFFGLFAATALSGLMLGLSLPYIDHSVFYLAYANFISVSVLLILTALVSFPDLLADIVEVAEQAYAKSKLTNVDVPAALERLESVMTQDLVYQNENLNLETLSELVSLSNHQLSELINSQFAVGFSRYVREQRILAAKLLLLDEPKTSVLVISMMTGFKSQSNFYTAFRELTGTSPGQYRTQALGHDNASNS